jgi:hypothetical protein
VITVDTSLAQSGSASIKMVMPTSYEYWISQTISTQGLVTGDRIRLQGYYREDRLSGPTDIAVQVEGEFHYIDPPATVDEWQPFSVDAFITNSASMQINFLSFGPMDNQPTTLWFDNLRAERVP